jgi:Fic/DOC family
MARQIIELSACLFETVLRDQSLGRAELWQMGFDTPKLWHRADPKCILFEADIALYRLGYRPVLHKNVVALAIVSAGAQPQIWPRPLPDDRTIQLLDALQPILIAGEGLSAHERLELAAAFETARNASPMGTEPLSLLAPTAKRQRRLQAAGLRMSRKFESQLAQLDQELSLYRECVREADLEECIAALSSYAELGIGLRLRPGRQPGDSCMGFLTTSRRASLEGVMETAAGLSDATLQALAWHAPHSGRHDLPITAADLARLQTIATSSAHRDARSPWRTYDGGDPSPSRRSALASPVPSAAVSDGAERWIAACDRRRWTGVHPLVAAAILHVEFVRLSPYQRANRRIGRILLQAQLYERGWPVLPWHVAFERSHDDYLDALESALGKRSHEPFLAFLLDACAVAISKGKEMVSALRTERDRLIGALLTDGGVTKEEVRDYAEALLGGVFLEGFSMERGIANDRALLKRMHALGHIDSLRSPFGKVYSAPICRDLMKSSAHQ